MSRKTFSILFLCVAMLALPIIAAHAQPDSDGVYQIDIKNIEYGQYLNNRGDSIFTLITTMLVPVPSGRTGGVHDSLIDARTQYLDYNTAILTIRDSLVIPRARGGTSVIVKYPTYTDTFALTITSAGQRLVVNLDTAGLHHARCFLCYGSNVLDTIGGARRRMLFRSIKRGMALEDASSILGDGGHYGYSTRYYSTTNGISRWVLDMHDCLYVEYDADTRTVQRAWIGSEVGEMEERR